MQFILKASESEDVRIYGVNIALSEDTHRVCSASVIIKTI